jgi:exonuclease SbcC
MRPRRLSVRGFTSFRDEQHLDFEPLDVFVIAGPTGAGKSSILDAITYALYGQVERIGNQCSQLVSHGLPNLAVTLDFDVDGAAYRITRTTPAAGRPGATKVSLERATVEGDAYSSFGEGADRVRECDEHVRHLIGLDYDGFTRSVLLPQGKFAEFMAGGAAQRRDILTDLLGLALFPRMAQRANRIGADAEFEASSKQSIVDTEYQGVTATALDEARQLLTGAERREQALMRAHTTVSGFARAATDARQAADSQRGCAAELRQQSNQAQTIAKLVRSFQENLRGLDQQRARANAAVADAEASVNAAQRDRQAAQAAWGQELEIATALGWAQTLPRVRLDISDREQELDRRRARTPVLEAARQTCEQAIVDAHAAAAVAERALEVARHRREQVERADRVAALVHGLAPGDACPVCGERLDAVPKSPGAAAVKQARADEVSAERARTEAERNVSVCQRAADGAGRDVGGHRQELERLTAEAGARSAERKALEAQLAAALRGPLPPDPADELAHRLKQLRAFAQVETEGLGAHAQAVRTLEDIDRQLQVLAARVDAERDRLVGSPPEAFRRALALLSVDAASWPAVPPSDASVADLAAFASSKAAILDQLAQALETKAAQQAALQVDLLHQAHAAVGDLVPPQADLTTLGERVERAYRDAGVEKVKAEARAALLTDRLANRQQLEHDVQSQTTRSATYKAVGFDLAGNRMVDFLLDEAQQALAVAGSAHLGHLSDGRYQLRFDRRDFGVVDKWNGDEERSVKTLSGGETFLASLSLALALAEQVQSLAVVPSARLDSFFLDEGFGTLDSETLEVVVEAIAQLGGDGRLVGVITHVPELAGRFPGFQVEKSARGSRISPRAVSD